MNVVAILGSPKEFNSATELILDEYLRGLEYNSNTVTKFKLSEKEVHGCKGCNYCGFGQRYCIQKDDMQEIYPCIEEADFIVLAMPVYWFSMPSQIKACIDRFYALGTDIWKGKKLGVISTYGGGDNESSGYNLIEATIKTICELLGVEYVMSYAMSGEDLRAEDTKELYKEKLFTLGKNMI